MGRIGAEEGVACMHLVERCSPLPAAAWSSAWDVEEDS
jgi:hypothetical protein